MPSRGAGNAAVIFRSNKARYTRILKVKQTEKLARRGNIFSQLFLETLLNAAPFTFSKFSSNYVELRKKNFFYEIFLI